MDSLYGIDFLNFLFQSSGSTEDALKEFILTKSGCKNLEEARTIKELQIYFKVLDNLYIG